jgi:phosphohistidine phosphatase
MVPADAHDRGTGFMELYFLRHGQSVPRSEWSGDDASRPLTEAGVSALAHAAWTLGRLGVKPDVLVTSPMERAQRTAEIVAPALGLEGKLSTARCLGRGFGMKKLRRLLREHPRAGSIMLVGHNPEFTVVIHKLTGAHLTLGKGGLARVHLSARKSRSAELVWLLQADELVRLAQNHASPWTSSAHHDEAEGTAQDQPPSPGAR